MGGVASLPRPLTGQKPPHRAEFGFSPQNEFTPPPKGEGAGYCFSLVVRVLLGSCLWQLLATTGSHASNRACLGLRWCHFLTWLSKSHTEAHRGKFVFTSVFPQPFPAGSNRQLLQHENVVGQKKIFSPMTFSLVSLSHIFSVGFPPRFSKYVLRSLFFVLCGSIFAWRASPLLG